MTDPRAAGTKRQMMLLLSWTKRVLACLCVCLVLVCLEFWPWFFINYYLDQCILYKAYDTGRGCVMNASVWFFTQVASGIPPGRS